MVIFNRLHVCFLELRYVLEDGFGNEGWFFGVDYSVQFSGHSLTRIGVGLANSEPKMD